MVKLWWGMVQGEEKNREKNREKKHWRVTCLLLIQFLQDLKNQILTTNLWVETVRLQFIPFYVHPSRGHTIPYRSIVTIPYHTIRWATDTFIPYYVLHTELRKFNSKSNLGTVSNFCLNITLSWVLYQNCHTKRWKKCYWHKVSQNAHNSHE